MITPKDDVDELSSLTNQTLSVQQAQANSIKSSVDIANKTRFLAEQSYQTLGIQGEKLNNVTNKLDTSNDSVENSKVKVDHLTKLNNRPFFIPVFNPKQPKNKPTSNDVGNVLWGPRTTSLPPTTPIQEPEKQYQAKVGEWASLEQQAESVKYEEEIDKGLGQISGTLNILKSLSVVKTYHKPRLIICNRE